MKFFLKKSSLIIAFILFSFLAVNLCQAAFIKDDIKKKIEEQAKAENYGYENTTGSEGILRVVQVAINAFLSLIGIILLIYILYAGYTWMTARGDEEKVTKAKDTLTRAIIGAIIIISAYAISIFIVDRMQQGTLKNGASASIRARA